MNIRKNPKGAAAPFLVIILLQTYITRQMEKLQLSFKLMLTKARVYVILITKLRYIKYNILRKEP